MHETDKVGYRRNEYEKNKLNKRYKLKSRKGRSKENEDILLRLWKEQGSNKE